ncbi:MAG: zincin-like metallopeptidase domain-containing protein [Bacteroidota bacterium]
MRTKKNSSDVYQIITDYIIRQLEQGIIPWKRPWRSVGTPRNFLTKKSYRGINLLLLGMNDYATPDYLTYKQAQQLGGHIKKGTKSQIVVFWQMRYYDEITKSWKNLTQQQTPPKGSKIVPLLRYYRVFNLEDTEGIDYTVPEMPEPTQDLSTDQLAQAMLPAQALTGLQVICGGNRACYSPPLDTIYMPSIHHFHCTSAYVNTLYHELSHSTGHQDRLARVGITEAVNNRSERYAKEELIAELGSCFLMHHYGYNRKELLDNSAAYLQSWLGRLHNDKKLIVEAAAGAQKAVDYILDQVEEQSAAVPA